MSLFNWKISPLRTGTLSFLLIPSSYDTAFRMACSPSTPAGRMNSPTVFYFHEIFWLIIVTESLPECQRREQSVWRWWYVRHRTGRALRDPSFQKASRHQTTRPLVGRQHFPDFSTADLCQNSYSLEGMIIQRMKHEKHLFFSSQRGQQSRPSGYLGLCHKHADSVWSPLQMVLLWLPASSL